MDFLNGSDLIFSVGIPNCGCIVKTWSNKSFEHSFLCLLVADLDVAPEAAHSITNNLLAQIKSTPLPTLFPLFDLPGLFSTFFGDKIIKLRLDLDSQPVCTSCLPLTNPADGVPLCTFKPVSESVVKNLILKSATKTCQLDPVPTPLLVECLNTLLPSLTALVNSSLSSGIFPEVFKTALVTQLLKKKSLAQNELKNYCPVSSLSFVCKIIEKLVLSQLSDHLSANNLYNRFQSAY